MKILLVSRLDRLGRRARYDGQGRHIPGDDAVCGNDRAVTDGHPLEDDRAACHAIRLFEELGLRVGDNQPYSGRDLNATMNRHAEAMGRPYCAIEIRNDLIAQEAGQARFAALIADVAGRVQLALESAP